MATASPQSGVVLPAPNTASNTAAIRSLGSRDLRPIVISEHDRSPGYESRYCAEQVAAPDPNVDLPAYEQALLALARRADVGTVLPFREADIYVLARNRENLAAEIGTPWPDIGTLQSVQDRTELFAAAGRADVAMPRTTTFDDWDDWDQPVIVKPRYTVHAPEYSDAVPYPTTVTASTRYVDPGSQPERSALVDAMGHEPIVQEFLPTTDEYGFFALYDEGEPVATFQHRQRRGWKYTGGPSAYRESVSIPALERAGLALLDELDWHGLAMVEFLRDPDTDEFKLMEINPRFWSSLPFTVQAGVDFPYLAWLLADGQPLPPAPTYETGIGGHLIRGELLYLYSILGERSALVDRPSFLRQVAAVGASIVREPRFDYLSRDDPDPFVRDVLNTVSEVV